MAVDRERHSALLRLYYAAGQLPLALQSALARLIYSVLYRLTGYRRGVVHNNLQRAFPQKNATELTLLQKKYYRHLSNLAMELLRGMHMTEEEFAASVHQTNPDVLQACTDNYQRSVIILTIHQGNWEWMLHGSNAAIPLPFVAIYKPLHSAAADQFMYRLRSRFGATAVPVRQAARDVLAKREKPRCIVMLADQSPTPDEQTYWPLFFGSPTAFHAGPARLAALTGHPVVFAQCRRQSTGQYCVIYEVLAEADKPVDEAQLTQRYATAAEKAINADPESWLWSNRRWKRS